MVLATLSGVIACMQWQLEKLSVVQDSLQDGDELSVVT